MKIDNAIVVKVDGIDGCGKTTLLGALTLYYKSQGFRVSSIGENGAYGDISVSFNDKEIPLYDFLRSQAKSRDNDLDNVERELIWVVIGRRTNSRVIPKLIMTNDIVFVDRSNLGNIAYGCSLDERLEVVYRLFSTSVEIADVMIWLDTPVDMCFQRLSTRTLDRIEEMGKTFFNKVRNRYLELANSNRDIQRIDGSESRDDVLKCAIRIVDDYICQRQQAGTRTIAP